MVRCDCAMVLRIFQQLSPFSFNVYPFKAAENQIFSIEAILRHKQVACMRRKMLFTIFKYLFFSRDIQVFKICKLA